MKPAKSVLLTMSLCLLLTACFRIEYTIKVDDDGSVGIDQVLAINVDEFSPESVGLEGSSIPRGARGAFCDGVRDGISDTRPELPGQRISDYKSGGYCGVRVSMELEAAPDHSSMLTGILEQNTRLVRAGEGWEFETNITPGQAADTAGFDLDELEDALAGAELLFHLDLPGKAIDGEHNATSVSGGKFTWEIDLLNPQTRLYARTEPATGLDKLPVSPKTIAVILGNMALLGGVAWFFMRPEDDPVPAAAAATATAGATSSAGTYGAPTVATVEKGTPYFDDTYGIWMLDDPNQGLLWHREGTDEWVPF